ncbi:MAG: FAD:protein FMN transferase [Muribaculum sp.]|nr:FAD:protein FMN transferase [Muribaculum sp.]
MAAFLFLSGLLLVWQKHREAQALHAKDLFAMDTLFSLKVYGAQGDEALKQCETRVRELEGLLSVTKADSDISKLNNRSGQNTEGILVSADTYSLLRTAVSLGSETEGALDITLYPIVREWGFTTGEYQIPKAERIQTLLQKVDYQTILLEPPMSDGGGTVCVPNGVELDLGAVAKGYTGDCLLDILRDMGVTSAILDLGGNVQTLGAKPDGFPWRIAVRNPFDRTKELGVLEVTDKSVITSGGYERYFTGEDGKDYWHILDPADGYPADNGLVSVTVVGESGVRCDGLSTALFVMGKDRAVNLYQQQQDFEMLLVTNEGELYITEGLTDCFECSENHNTEIIYRN